MQGKNAEKQSEILEGGRVHAMRLTHFWRRDRADLDSATPDSRRIGEIVP